MKLDSVIKLFFAICALSLAIGQASAHSKPNKLDMLPYNDELENIQIELLVSYKLISQDNLIKAERYRVSHALSYRGEKLASIKECEIDASSYAIMDDMAYFITSILKQEKEQMLECLLGHEVNIRDTTSGRSGAIRSKTSLEIAPTRIKAKLVNKSIIVSVLQKESR